MSKFGFLCLSAVTAKTSLNYPWLGRELLELIARNNTSIVVVAKEVLAVTLEFDSGITEALNRLRRTWHENLPRNHFISPESLTLSIQSLKTLLVGREKLYLIAKNAISNPVDPSGWMDVNVKDTFENQLEAITIATNWDELHEKYSPETHDNVTVASVAAVVSFELHLLSDRYTSLGESVNDWIFNMDFISDLVSPEGFRYGDRSVKYAECDIDMKTSVKENLLMLPYARLWSQVGTDLLELPASHPLMTTPRTAHTSRTTTTTSMPTFAPTSKSDFQDLLPPVLDMIIDALNGHNTRTNDKDWGYWKNGQYVTYADLEFWFPTVEDSGVWAGRSMMNPAR